MFLKDNIYYFLKTIFVFNTCLNYRKLIVVWATMWTIIVFMWTIIVLMWNLFYFYIYFFMIIFICENNFFFVKHIFKRTIGQFFFNLNVDICFYFWKIFFPLTNCYEQHFVYEEVKLNTFTSKFVYIFVTSTNNKYTLHLLGPLFQLYSVLVVFLKVVNFFPVVDLKCIFFRNIILSITIKYENE